MKISSLTLALFAMVTVLAACGPRVSSQPLKGEFDTVEKQFTLKVQSTADINSQDEPQDDSQNGSQDADSIGINEVKIKGAFTSEEYLFEYESSADQQYKASIKTTTEFATTDLIAIGALEYIVGNYELEWAVLDRFGKVISTTPVKWNRVVYLPKGRLRLTLRLYNAPVMRAKLFFGVKAATGDSVSTD